jgi:hypothetical protein
MERTALAPSPTAAATRLTEVASGGESSGHAGFKRQRWAPQRCPGGAEFFGVQLGVGTDEARPVKGKLGQPLGFRSRSDEAEQAGASVFRYAPVELLVRVPLRDTEAWNSKRQLFVDRTCKSTDGITISRLQPPLGANSSKTER